MLYWLIRATQVTRLIYQFVLATMMTANLLKEGVRTAKKRKVQRQMRNPQLAL